MLSYMHVKQKSSLQTQIDTLLQYANSNGFCVNKIYKDIASGLNFDRGEFQLLLSDVIQYKIKTVFITKKAEYPLICGKSYLVILTVI